MLNALRQIGQLLGQTSSSDGTELIQLNSGQLFEVKDDDKSIPVFKSATLTVRKTASPFHYELVASDNALDERSTLIDTCMKFRKLSADDKISFLWLDSDVLMKYSFDSNSINKHTVDFFETTVLECMFERKYQKSHDLASAADLELLRYDPKNPTKPLKKASTLPEATELNEPTGNVVAVCTGDLHIYDPNTLNFVLFPDGSDATGKIIDCGKFNFQFSVSKGQKSFLAQPLDNTMNPVFSSQHTSFIWNFFNESTGVSYSWSLKFNDPKLFDDFRDMFGKCMYEGLNKEYFKKVKEEDQSYLTRAYAEDIEMADASEEGESSEEEFYSDEGEGEEPAIQSAKIPEKEGKNSLLAVGYKHHRSFVVRGDKIGVFSHDHDNLKYSTTINSVMTPKGKFFSPAKVMLHNQDSNMVLMDPNNRGSLFKMDLEVGKVVEEWKIDENRNLIDFTPDAKYSQMTPQQTFIGLSHNAVFRVDPRQSGSKLVESQLNQYKSKNEFSCTTATGKGDVVIASDKGDLRLYNQIDKRAKTHLPGLGDPIIGIDVTEDGKFILATCKSYLLLMKSDAETEGGSVNGFQKSLGSSKPTPIRLQLKPEHVAWINEPISFTAARFNTGDDMEKKIVASTGPYVITWNFRRVKAGHRYDYTIKKYPDKIVADQFQHGNDQKVIVTLPDDVALASRRDFSTPQKLFTPVKNLRNKENAVNSPY